jgi:hypothetical protein
MTTDVAAAPCATLSPYAQAAFEEGRHRRVFPQLVVHLVFVDLSEHRLGADTSLGRSLGHLASWLVEC